MSFDLNVIPKALRSIKLIETDLVEKGTFNPVFDYLCYTKNADQTVLSAYKQTLPRYKKLWLYIKNRIFSNKHNLEIAKKFLDYISFSQELASNEVSNPVAEHIKFSQSKITESEKMRNKNSFFGKLARLFHLSKSSKIEEKIKNKGFYKILDSVLGKINGLRKERESNISKLNNIEKELKFIGKNNSNMQEPTDILEKKEIEKNSSTENEQYVSKRVNNPTKMINKTRHKMLTDEKKALQEKINSYEKYGFLPYRKNEGSIWIPGS